MSQMTLRLPESLHKSLREIAEKENISANQFINLAVAEKISALTTADLIEQRTARIPDRNRYEELLVKAPDVEPDEEDRL